jgi:hypothetical protein
MSPITSRAAVRKRIESLCENEKVEPGMRASSVSIPDEMMGMFTPVGIRGYDAAVGRRVL